MVARNRFLAESMLNGQKTPKSPKPKYSVPTCHSTLKQLEQARLAKEFELQRRKSLQHHPVTSTTGSPKSISRDFYNNNNNNNNHSDEKTRETNYEEIKLKRSLSRATSVGKLVNTFENGQFTKEEEQNHIGASSKDFFPQDIGAGYDADDDEISDAANPEEVLNFGGKIQMMKPVIAIKPPLATKPFLRHTVSGFVVVVVLV